MKTEKNILIAFILNLGFSIFEFFGGIFSGSVAIISDSIHDIGDAISIGLAFFLEKKSKTQPDKNYTYGYQRFSVIGSVITTLILIVGSVFVIIGAVNRIINPTEIKYNTMIVFAIIGVCVNFVAALFTHGEGSLNQRAVNLHMLEDVLGWIIVLVGAIIMKFTDITLIDPIMSICVSLFILINAIKTLKEAVDIFLEKSSLDTDRIKEEVLSVDEVKDVHHVHIWSMDGKQNYATMHIVTEADSHEIKENVREKLYALGIAHVTLELEKTDEHCHEKECKVEFSEHSCHHHHHHHHH